jgi:hypothetical protein
LKAQRLAATGGQHSKNVATVQSLPDDLGLMRPEGIKAEILFEQTFEL